MYYKTEICVIIVNQYVCIELEQVEICVFWISKSLCGNFGIRAKQKTDYITTNVRFVLVAHDCLITQ